MTALSVTPEDGGGTAYSKSVSDLQENISISRQNKISGRLKYVKGYTGFSSTDNDGNFLALKIEYPEDATVKITLIGGSTKDKAIPRGDHLLVTKVKDAATQKIKLDITKGDKTGSVTYDLSGLTLDPKST